MNTSIATLVLLGSAVVGTPALAAISAHAGEQEETHKMVVHYGDLNVNTELGAQELYRRISYAAHEVCGDVTDPAYSTLDHAYQQCRRTAMEQAVAKVDRPILTALYDQHFPDNPLVVAKPSGHGSRSVG
jgi:UrcA family protein